MIELNFGLAPGSIIITGAASGIGRETALEAARQGLHVIAWDIDEAALSRLKAEIAEFHQGHSEIATKVVDIADRAVVAEAVSEACQSFTPRYLVNNAGPPSQSQLDFTDALSKTAGATRDLTRLWLDHGVEDPVAVNVCSIAGNLLGLGEWYSSAKAAIMGYTRHLATARPNGLRVNAVAPGLIDTPRVASTLSSERGNDIVMRNPLGRAGEPREIATVILFLLSPSASYVNGALVVCDGGSSLTF